MNFDSEELFESIQKKDKKYESSIENSFETYNYLYPNGHRTTHQMRWFKGSRDRGIVNDDLA